MEIVLVELSNKARKVAMLEMLRKDGFCEFLVLELVKIARKKYGQAVSLTSNTTKLSSSSPHLTTDAYDGSSNILFYPVNIALSLTGRVPLCRPLVIAHTCIISAPREQRLC